MSCENIITEIGNNEQEHSMTEVVVSTIVVENNEIKDQDSDVIGIGNKLTVGQIVHQCGQCDAYSFDKDIVERHIGLIHDKKMPLECMLCYAVFVDPKSLKKHKAIVHKEIQPEDKPYQCGYCQSTFRDNGAVNRHVSSVHEGKKPFQCDVCTKSYSQKAHLLGHVAAVHEGKKPYKCNLCEKSYAYKNLLTAHVQTIHEGVKPFKCPICPAGFVQKRVLQAHIDSVHLGKKVKKERFTCDQCSSDFSTKKNLEVHVLTVHEGIKPFECSVCDQSFATKSNLKQHLLKHSSNEDESSKNKLTEKAKVYVRNIFDMGALTGRDHRNVVASETAIRMQEEVDESGEPFFKPEELLDSLQIKSLFYKFTQHNKLKSKERLKKQRKNTKKFTKEKTKIKTLEYNVKIEPAGGMASDTEKSIDRGNLLRGIVNWSDVEQFFFKT